MKHTFLSLLLCFIATLTTGQPSIQWQKKYGGTSMDGANSIIQTKDGGYIAMGASSSNDGDVTGHHGNTTSDDIWVVKMRPDGSLQWQKSFGGTKSDFGNVIRQTKDGGYIFIGTVTSSDGDVSTYYGSYDYWVVKLDEAGNIQWEKTYGSADFEIGNDIVETDNGGYFVVGSKDADYWLLKLDAQGTLLWSHTYGGSEQESAPRLAATTDKGCVIVGWSWSKDGDVSGHHGDNGDYWVVKVDKLGSIQWETSLGGSYLEQSESIIQTSEGGYLVSGYSHSNNGDVTGHHGLVGDSKDGWLVKLDPQGEIQWQKSLGGSQEDDISSVYQTMDGGFVVAGFTSSNDGDVSGVLQGNGDCWMLKLGPDGAIIWQSVIGGSNFDHILSCIQTMDGGYAFTGFTNSNDGDVLPTGNGMTDYWIVKLGPEILDVANLPNSFAGKVLISPNPSVQSITLSITSEEPSISVQIIDFLGHQCLQQNLANGGSLDISRFPNGIYSVLATTPSGKVYSNKICKQE